MVVKVLAKKKLKDSICVVVGTRPGIIKMSPVIRAFESRQKDMFLLHTGQHYSFDMDRSFFRDLGLKEPDYQLARDTEGTLHGQQTARMLIGIEQVLINQRPRLVLVCGDANTNLAGALAARKLQIEVGHVESGLRSYNWQMPEEHNRIIIDHISEYLFAPTPLAVQNLIDDGVKGKVFLTGNTIVDALYQNLAIANEKSTTLDDLSLTKRSYLLVTMHREENVDHRDNLSRLADILERVSNEFPFSVLFPCHPRTVKRIRDFNLQDRFSTIKNVCILNPLGYLDFLVLLENAFAVFTDSGGIQEESCILQVPCITLRDDTERQETVEVGGNRVAGLTPMSVLQALESFRGIKKSWLNPYGDGKAAERIADVAEGKEPSLFETCNIGAESERH